MAKNATEKKELFMALTKAQVREILSEAGVEKENMSEAVEKIINGHLASIDVLRETIDDQKKEIEASKKELDELKGDGTDYREKYEKEHEAFKAYKADVEQKGVRESKEKAMRGILKEIGISEKRLDSVLKLCDVDGLELTTKGEIKGKDKLAESLKDEWSDFISTTSVEGANTANPPTGGEGAKMTKEQIFAIKDTGERQRAIAQNLDLFDGG